MATAGLSGATNVAPVVVPLPHVTAPGFRHPSLSPTTEEIQAEIAHVLNKQLSPDLLKWVDGYAQVGKRNLYLWKWVRQGVEVTTLSCIAPDLFDFACNTKVLGVVLDVLMDDIADRKGDPDLLEQLLSVTFDDSRFQLTKVSAEDRAYAEFTIDIWEEI